MASKDKGPAPKESAVLPQSRLSAPPAPRGKGRPRRAAPVAAVPPRAPSPPSSPLSVSSGSDTSDSSDDEVVVLPPKPTLLSQVVAAAKYNHTRRVAAVEILEGREDAEHNAQMLADRFRSEEFKEHFAEQEQEPEQEALPEREFLAHEYLLGIVTGASLAVLVRRVLSLF